MKLFSHSNKGKGVLEELLQQETEVDELGNCELYSSLSLSTYSIPLV